MPADIYRIIPESELIPELSSYRTIYKFKSSCFYKTIRKFLFMRSHVTNLKGWYIQQINKLAIAPYIETDFYLTLDADNVCYRKVHYDRLIKDNRAVVNTEPFNHHDDWYKPSEAVLGMKRSGKNHGVTPSLLSKQAVLDLQVYLEKRINPLLKLTSRLLPRDLMLTKVMNTWRSYLLRNIPWTEYTLYHTFLESTQSWDHYHFDGGNDAVYDANDSLWYKDNFAEWTVNKYDQHAPFIVVQSNTGISIDDIRKKLDFETN